MKKNLIYMLVFSIFLFSSISFAECNHVYEIVEIDKEGKHNRICTLCGNAESSEQHILEDVWSFDDEGKEHLKKCTFNGCLYEYNRGVHLGGNHDNGGICSVCNGIYQTHELNGENVQYNDKYHWYICSYSECNYVYDQEEHEETRYINGDFEYHWYRCKGFDCAYRFNQEKHYGGNVNNGFCEFELCEKLYIAKLQIDEYEYREYNVGDKDRLVANIIPKDIEVPEAEYKWSSSMPKVVSVDENGNIEALREGISIIYCTYGKYTAKCVIAVGNLNFSIEPIIHNIYPNEIGISNIDVTYEKNKKAINVNEYVDFDAFKWEKNSFKAAIKSINENEVQFIGINESDVSVIFYMRLDSRMSSLEKQIDKIYEFNRFLVDNTFFQEETLINKENLSEVKKEINKVIEKIDEEKSNNEMLEVKKCLIEINKIIKDNGNFEEEKLSELQKLFLDLWGKLQSYRKEVIVNVLKVVTPEETSEETPEQTPAETPEETPEQIPEETPDPNDEEPIHSPESGVTTNLGQNVINRRHICSYQSYFPNPKDPESGHLKRCYYADCEFYKKGIEGSEAEHNFKYNSDKQTNICISCFYEQGSGASEPEIIHSRDFGIDVLQSQYIIVKDIITEVDVIITGVESDVKIYYGPVGGTMKSTAGRDDENSVKLMWDVKDEYAKEALDIEFEKREDKRILKIELKDGYAKSARSEIDLILENNFGEKRIETIEVIKEAPERAQFILRFSDTIRSIKKGETVEVTVICKSTYGYGTDAPEIQEYYKNKNLINYENIELKWEGSGGITVIGDSTPNSEGYAKGKITGVSVTDNSTPAIITITGTAKYENGDLVDEVERELKRGLRVYEANNNQNFSPVYSQGNQSTPPSQSNNNNTGSSLPVAAGVVGGLGIICVVFVVGKMTKG